MTVGKEKEEVGESGVGRIEGRGEIVGVGKGGKSRPRVGKEIGVVILVGVEAGVGVAVAVGVAVGVAVAEEAVKPVSQKVIDPTGWFQRILVPHSCMQYYCISMKSLI